jgi:hypothetical protein
VAHHDDGADLRADLEHQRAVATSRQRIRRQLAEIAQIAPRHEITVESYPGRRDRYVAKAITPGATPYLLITDDPNELYIELASPPGVRARKAVPGSASTRPDPFGS